MKMNELITWETKTWSIKENIKEEIIRQDIMENG